MIADYRINVRVRNNRIMRALEDYGVVFHAKRGTKLEPSQCSRRTFCENNGISYQTLSNLISLREKPKNWHGNYRPVAIRISDALGVLPEDLWTPEQEQGLPTNMAETYASEQDLAVLGYRQHGDIEAIESQVSAENLTGELMSKLSTRHFDILARRFGLGGHEAKALKDVAADLHVSPERIRQLEAKALMKIRVRINDRSDSSPDHLKLVEACTAQAGRSERVRLNP